MSNPQSSWVSRYRNIAKALQTLEQRPCWMTFDAEADVLYINFQNPAQSATDSEVTDDDVIIRYAGDEVVGITVLSVRQR
ncbi:DUF2283 domain-containing protein [Leptolyngbya sp. PCC 6406]|uniref:DUF2283 domain-containing protein n=1 Tax=Leptolyngbya sp. PCC 6406 TaxID=1173264 RepID=UPI0002AC190C|nr:DUF2283 domain-containing protein [Leptolyngbya sp. PCC 6406]